MWEAKRLGTLSGFLANSDYYRIFWQSNRSLLACNRARHQDVEAATQYHPCTWLLFLQQKLKIVCRLWSKSIRSLPSFQQQTTTCTSLTTELKTMFQEETWMKPKNRLSFLEAELTPSEAVSSLVSRFLFCSIGSRPFPNKMQIGVPCLASALSVNLDTKKLSSISILKPFRPITMSVMNCILKKFHLRLSPTFTRGNYRKELWSAWAVRNSIFISLTLFRPTRSKYCNEFGPPKH